ncbi:PREDICTED: uncharacterized protein LOC108565038 isoform X2 [Nicrophorus vespilloides]|uniref:Uncharacterized protein LOC108565038 isoform X2 n=1 Tax=Nicrophorus vespilloides TaxID=110193 RepID=A0ABM1MYX8_NICVS|nr:PREDICTED: uncharacterized protein LOC108565038 isoform X2 [Nicrophorus vespilloides]
MSSISNNFSAPVLDFTTESSSCTSRRKGSNDRSNPTPSVSSISGPSTSSNYMHSMPSIDHITRSTVTPHRHSQRHEHSFRSVVPSNPTRRPRSRYAMMSSMRNEQIDGMSNIRSGNPRIPVHQERTPSEKSDLQWLDKLSVAIPDLAKQPSVYFQSDTNS